MGKDVFKTGRKIRAEHAQIQGAAKKRGLWSSLGSALLGGLAALVTGGASIAVQAAVAAAGTFAGGHIGNFLAGTTDEGKLKGGRFFQGSRTSLSKQIKEGINVGALKAGLMAGLSAAGGKFKFGKEGASVTAGKEGFKLGDIFKPGESAHTYKDTFWGKVGKTLDFKGSAIGKGLERSAARKLAEKSTRIDEMLVGRDTLVKPSFEDVMSSGKASLTEGTSLMPDPLDAWAETDPYAVPGSRDMSLLDKALAKRSLIESRPKGLSTFAGGSGTDETRAIFSEEEMWAGTDPYAVPGSRDMSLKDKAFAKRNLIESRPEGLSFNEGGEGTDYTFTMARPNVPVASEETFFDEDIIVEDTDFSEFGDWEKPMSREQAYWGSGTPAVEELLGSETGTGLTSYEARLADPTLQQTDPSLGLQSSDYDLLAPSRKRAADLQRSLETGKRLNLYPRLFPGD